MNKSLAKPSTVLLTKEFRVAFIMVTTLFVLWGFANDITNPMVAAFKNVLLLSNFESSLVQAAFYGGYCLMAIPAALFIRRYSYKSGILCGLGLYAFGCFLFIPSGYAMAFSLFLIAYFIMTSGLAFLETTANPYILSMGSENTAARRLNLSQAFNPVGSLCGMLVAKEFILGNIQPISEADRRIMAISNPEALATIQISDLQTIVIPYALLGITVLGVLVFFIFAKLPNTSPHRKSDGTTYDSLRRLFTNFRYVGGVIAQIFYVGVQIMVWTFIIQYGVNELNLSPGTAQAYNIVAMIIFVCSRFICTYLLKFIDAGLLLAVLAAGGALLILGTIFLHGMWGLYSLVGVSSCMSLMFPTIYGIALDNLGDDAKLGSAGLICAIGGGCIMPPLQALIMDGSSLVIGGYVLSSTRLSFFLPFICFVVVGLYGIFIKMLNKTELQKC